MLSRLADAIMRLVRVEECACIAKSLGSSFEGTVAGCSSPTSIDRAAPKLISAGIWTHDRAISRSVAEFEILRDLEPSVLHMKLAGLRAPLPPIAVVEEGQHALRSPTGLGRKLDSSGASPGLEAPGGHQEPIGLIHARLGAMDAPDRCPVPGFQTSEAPARISAVMEILDNRLEGADATPVCSEQMSKLLDIGNAEEVSGPPVTRPVAALEQPTVPMSEPPASRDVHRGGAEPQLISRPWTAGESHADVALTTLMVTTPDGVVERLASSSPRFAGETTTQFDLVPISVGLSFLNAAMLPGWPQPIVPGRPRGSRNSAASASKHASGQTEAETLSGLMPSYRPRAILRRLRRSLRLARNKKGLLSGLAIVVGGVAAALETLFQELEEIESERVANLSGRRSLLNLR